VTDRNRGPGGTLAVRGSVDQRELVARAVQGDHEAFVAIVQRYDDRLRRLAARLLAGDQHRVDDAMQDAYVQAYRSLGRFRGDADLGTWLYRIVSNTCIDHLRRAQRRPRPVDLAEPRWDVPARGSGPEDAAAARDAATRALAGLTPDQRAVVVLVDGEGWDYQAAAALLGVAPGTVASRLARARSEVRRVLQEGER